MRRLARFLGRPNAAIGATLLLLVFVTALYVGVNLVVDLFYPVFDPRVRL